IGNSTGTLRGHEGVRIPADDGVIGWVVERAEPVIIPNLSDDERGFDFGQGLGPAVVVPIMNVGKAIGAFLVARLSESRPFPEESAAVLQQMAAYAAIAITNAQTHHRQREVAE